MFHGDFSKRRALIGALALLPLAAARAQAGKTFKILHVMSYHSPWRWTDWQLESFQQALGVPVEVKVFQMDTKRNSTPEAKERVGAEARALVASWKPDLLYTSDDDAPQFVSKHFVNTPMPIVFSGLNADPAVYGFAGATNVAGVQEVEHFSDSVKLLQSFVPKAKKFVVVLDDARMWEPVVGRMRAQVPKLGIEVAAYERIQTWAEYKTKMASWQDKVDAVALIGIFNFKDDAGKNVPYQEVLKWTAENSKLPDLAFWLDRVQFGTLCSVTVSEREQGAAAGKLARAILVDGKAPNTLPMQPTTKGAPVINMARAKKLGLQIDPKALQGVEQVQRFDWDKA
ncbi:MAG: ABC transporter substrate-binding protein [Ramlibacter sp.]